VPVEVANLTKVFGGRRHPVVTAVDDASFSIRDNQVVGLLGANGAGKTTTIKCMCGLVRPTSGHVAVNGIDVATNLRRAAAQIAAVLEGDRNLHWRLSARENVDFYAGLQGISRRAGAAFRDELLERFGLTEKARTPARLLSRGMKQKLALVCALAHRAPVLLLDEPTLGLDVEISHELRGYIRTLAAEGHTILLSSHDMSIVEDICDRVVVLVAGRVVADDTVPNLLALFRAQAYRFVVTGALGAELRAQLEQRFPLLNAQPPDGGRTTIDVEFADDEGLNVLLSLLSSNGTSVVSIDREDPDLEQVFLHLIKRGRT
jgi:ABC-2 type transport system ATP-binding protein